MKWPHVGLLIWSIVSLIGSIYLIKNHQRMNNQLEDSETTYDVNFTDYLLTGVIGYVALPFSLVGIIAMIVLLIIG